ncbi:hypothetical protein ASD78_12285 [Lysobacter sp. Root667]|uniref:hypothetical protein n=1 Tax=Lysobacter sp. Root667 TaxID=1736581 RepID=UPI0006F2D7FC|nr:hypothetical protein [Lysobacter sp. Root667]KRA74264.1 hypothetical protein ASD78_12285 [Lysobacter sp. Root667]
MATFTRAELRNQVLGRLGVYDPNVAPTAADAKLVDDSIQNVLEELYTDGLIPFDVDTDALPSPYMIPLSFIAAQPLVLDFGVSQRQDQIDAGTERGMRRLRRLRAAPYVGGTVKSEYY